MVEDDYPRNKQEFLERFSTEQKCLEYLIRWRWPAGFECPACGSKKAWPHPRRLFECSTCGRQTSVTAGTIFQDTRKPLRLWFEVIWTVVSQKNGASAKNIEEALGFGSYRTAWTWLQKLRRAMIRPGRDHLCGTVEIDETYIGGEEDGQRGRGPTEKTLVVVAVECEPNRKPGRVRFRCIPDASGDSLLPFVVDNVKGGSNVITDGWLGYSGLGAKGYKHEVRKVAPSGKKAHELLPHVHLIDTLVKRWLLGTHQGHVSPKHLRYYLDEYAFRFNRRLSTHRGLLFHRLVTQALALEPVTYNHITAPPLQVMQPESSA